MGVIGNVAVTTAGDADHGAVGLKLGVCILVGHVGHPWCVLSGQQTGNSVARLSVMLVASPNCSARFLNSAKSSFRGRENSQLERADVQALAIEEPS